MSIIPIICYYYLRSQERRKKNAEEEIRNNISKVDDKSAYSKHLYYSPIRELRSAHIQQILNEKKGGTRL